MFDKDGKLKEKPKSATKKNDDGFDDLDDSKKEEKDDFDFFIE